MKWTNARHPDRQVVELRAAVDDDEWDDLTCPLCPAAFHTSQDLGMHFGIVHPIERWKKFPYEIHEQP